MSLAHVKRTYEKFGSEDPMFAVLSQRQFRHNRWDPEEFFRTGREEIAEALAYIEKLGLARGRGSALDFGCGVGRLSQALAEHFEKVSGVDIAESMIANARKWNKHGDRVQYHVNIADDLRCFPDNSFDFVYSNITLQHIPPEASANYVKEFARVLRPGGVCMFQVPNGAYFRSGSPAAFLYHLKRQYWRRFWKRVRGMAPVEIHYLPRRTVETVLEQAGARIVDVLNVSKHRREENFRYCFTK